MAAMLMLARRRGGRDYHNTNEGHKIQEEPETFHARLARVSGHIPNSSEGKSYFGIRAPEILVADPFRQQSQLTAFGATKLREDV
jgi:hypothetical protein